MTVVETERLILRELVPEDAGFILELVNDPDWLRNIGDRGVRDLDDARRYIEQGPATSYRKHGFGLWAVEPKGSGGPIGMCGLIRRDELECPDVGFAFLPAHRGRGYAIESASAVMGYARCVLEIPRVLAIVSPENTASTRLLKKLGFRYERELVLESGDRLLVHGSS